MQLSTEQPVSILPMARFPPAGVPIGSHAFVLKMTPEALEQLSAQLAAQQPATAPSSQVSRSSNARNTLEKSKKNEKPLMQLVVGDGGQPQFVIGNHTFRADAVNEQATCEIYARHQSPVSDSDQPATDPAASTQLQMVAKVDGRLQIKREYGSKVQQTVTERTARMNKEAQPRSAIILDAPVGATPNVLSKNANHHHHNKQLSTGVAQTTKPPSTTTARPDPKGQAALTPPKSDGSPSSTLSGPRGPKHQIPDAFATLNLNVPTRWDGNIPLPIRLIHLVALNPKTEMDLLTEAGLAGDAERKEGLRALSILCDKLPDGTMRLRDEAYYYLRPWCWVHYSPTNRASASKVMRIALRRLGYDDQYEVWSHVKQANGWVDPWKNTPEGMLHYREKEQKRAITEAAAKEDHEKQKAEALANPAPMLTSTIRPGFYSPNPTAPTKGKKVSKEKDPKVKKEKSSSSSKNASEKESVSHPKIAPGSSSGSNAAVSTASGTGVPTEPTVLESELKIRKSGPGSAGGKLAVAKRFQREKEEGRASTVSTPTRSPRPLPVASTSKNTTPVATSDSRKRKVDDDDFDAEPLAKKKKKAPATASQTSTLSSTVTKRKGDDIGSLSPPTKIRKDVKTGALTHVHNGSTSSLQGHASNTMKNSTVRKDKTSATGDFNRDKSRKRTSWDYSSDDDDGSTPSGSLKPGSSRSNGHGRPATLAPPSASGPSGNGKARGLPTPHPVAPPTNYLGYKAIFLQKLAEYEMVRGILLGEEAKLANARVGDSSQSLMGVIELRRLIRKRESLQVELREVKADIARLNGKTPPGTSGSR
ncbi:hypothetical protein M408DRAFT_21335 [Serendipita vermifera MAFF 305830]|uniref:RNA polymerase II elongation factor ELL N-terminal domain-containing protein n=1 Tax=Serendipita vermifera MAFF 305830 TaxID=933852 RepID=A0A0C3BGJ1_SERVB|nr:hypothetical protein M408DRAFT_21335 [Serendipita vermifera MAFF 305830]